MFGKFITKETPVEVIHKEFDDAEDKILKECDALLQELEIPTEDKVLRKGKLMEQLGFVNSETVQIAKSIQREHDAIKMKIVKTEETARLIRSLKLHYPNEKILTIAEFERICEKYKLIHAPAANYIRDIPEKNVLEMMNCTKLSSEHKPQNEFRITEVSDEDAFEKLLHFLGKTDYILTNEDVIKCHNLHRGKDYLGIVTNDWIFGGSSDHMVFYDTMKHLNINFYIREYETIKKDGIFIAAPESHFNLKGLDKKSKFGFFNVTVTELKDPIAFEFLKGGLIRILSKWGTPDDQSYLDDTLVNENLN